MDTVEPSERAPLAVEVSRAGTEVVVSVSGELDLSNVDALQARLDEVLISPPDLLIFELSELRFLDSSGIGLLVRASADVSAIRLRHPSDIVRQVIKYMGLSTILTMDPLTMDPQ